MGLLLSVLVVFVSVVELLAVYSNFRRNLQPAESDRDISPLIRRYEAGLHKERRRILKIIEEYRKHEETTAECPKSPVEKPSTSRCRSPPTLYHVEANLAENEDDSDAKSRSPSPFPIPTVPRNSVCTDFFYAKTSIGDEESDFNPVEKTIENILYEFPEKAPISLEEKVPCEKIASDIEQTGNSTHFDAKTNENGFPEFFEKTKKEQAPRKKIANGIEQTSPIHFGLQSASFDSTDYWSNRYLIEKKKSKGKDGRLKGSKKRVKFGLSLEEFEPEWSRAPSPIFKLITTSPDAVPNRVSTASLKKSKAVNFKSLQITDLNQQIVSEDYWRRSPSPFRDFLEPTSEEKSWDANKQIVSEDEDAENIDFGPSVDGLKFCPKYNEFLKADDSWNPNKDVISSDEDKEAIPSLDYINALDGLKSSKFDDKKRSFRRKQGRKSPKQNSLDIESKQNGLSSSENEIVVEKDDKRLIFTEESRNLCTAEKEEVIEYSESDEGSSNKERNAASNAFWLIFSGEYTKAMNKDWHGQHFCCWQCDESLTGQRYVLREEHPYCVACYESVFANSCEKCSRTIGIDSKDLSYKDKHWHEACFLCATCGDSLVDKQFGSKGDRIYCGRCYDEQFASRCDGCGQIFRAGTKKMEYKTRQWHEKCFCCCVCKTPIGTQSFIPREQEIYCAKCYEEKYATRCIKCNKVITSGGVTYKNEPWHRECFTCTNCNTSLAGARFTSRDDKPYCAECFGELFAKRCTACNKPITGIGGTKFISFEDRHWHNDCFFCASCRTSLVGRGFITDADDIICPECAKQKLM